LEVHKPQVLRSVTRRWSKASPGAYSPHRMLTRFLLYFSIHVMYYALCIGFLNDGDRLHGSTHLCTIHDVDVLLLRLHVLCLIDSHREKSSGRSHSHIETHFS
jgi:hypothetical protein